MSNVASAIPVSLERVLRNALWNLLGQGAAFGIRFATLPWIVHGIGVTAYGVWELAGVLLSYFAFLDLSLRLALVHRLSQAITRNDPDDVRMSLGSALVLMGLQGVGGLVLIRTLTPLLLQRAVAIPVEWYEVAAQVFWIRAVAFIVELGVGLLRAVPTALQRLDLVNRWTVAVTCVQAVGLAGMAQAGWGLVWMAFWVLATQGLALGIFYRVAVRWVPAVRTLRWSGARARALVRFGGWVTASHVIEPVLLHTEKIIISRTLGVEALAFYVIPYQLVTRLWALATGFTNALFPALSTAAALQDRTREAALVYGSIRLVSGVAAWVVMGLIVTARPLLTAWMGARFADPGARVLQILAVGLWINVINWPVYALFQARGQPQQPALFHAMEAIVYVPLAWGMVQGAGLPGAALAWTVRMTLDTGLLFVGSRRLGLTPLAEIRCAVLNPATLSAVAIGLGVAAVWERFSTTTALATLISAGAMGMIICWTQLVRPELQRFRQETAIKNRSSAY